MGEDISKKTVMVLLVLTVVVSVVGTWTVLDSVSSPSVNINSGTAGGKVSLGIVEPSDVQDTTLEPAVAGGKVQLTIE